MHLDVIDLRDFYSSLVGRIVTRSVGEALTSVMPKTQFGRLAGIGFATPYLSLFESQADVLKPIDGVSRTELKMPGDEVVEPDIKLGQVSVFVIFLVQFFIQGNGVDDEVVVVDAPLGGKVHRQLT